MTKYEFYTGIATSIMEMKNIHNHLHQLLEFDIK